MNANTIHVSSDTFAAIVRAAAAQGLSPDEWAEQALSERLPGGTSTATHDAGDERVKQPGILQKFFGSISSGDQNSADNERIDADLLRDYSRGLEDR